MERGIELSLIERHTEGWKPDTWRDVKGQKRLIYGAVHCVLKWLE